MTTLDAEVLPNHGLDFNQTNNYGSFKLGMPIGSAIKFIQKNYKDISTVELKYNEEELVTSAIIIDLVDQGLILRFEPISQRLLVIEAYDLKKISLRYSSKRFCGPDIPASFNDIYSCFGPCTPGRYDYEKSVYQLHYPGITFSFPISEDQASNFDVSTTLSLEFPGDKAPVASHMCIYHGSYDDFSLPLVSLPDLYYERLDVVISKGITFTQRGCTLDFNSTAQDVLSYLGRPDRIFYKEEDKMRIHAGNGITRGVQNQYLDYFYNYFSLGLDILLDTKTHTIKKFILHTNPPCHTDFNVYTKCNFKISLDDKTSTSEDMIQDVEEESESEEKESDGSEESDGDEGELINKRRIGKNKTDEGTSTTTTTTTISNERLIVPEMKWEQISKLFGTKPRDPVPGIGGKYQQLFGNTLFYYTKDIIFEVMRNGHIASVCLFSSEKC